MASLRRSDCDLYRERRLSELVKIETVDDLAAVFERRISDGSEFGDFQFSVERDSHDFLHQGVFSCYRPVPMETPILPAQKQLSDENWRQLLYLAHIDPKKALKNILITISRPMAKCTGQTRSS